ncbi:T9SS type B sorting domain-containing protein [Flavobacterium sp. SUN046]|uniref:T9SS type B sorting domain-containing protein n=1 Tax=Flavobacterium sp. SUN046 TaxID=3002440 RepID=UPI002DB85BE4|nr:T9SS type B sorting domain-containing protein [Flavobacterium sp. SUN046]MEC4049718.1 T9SS type B sorting domain-containing protein [Flavobacterium sp. SUN046]
MNKNLRLLFVLLPCLLFSQKEMTYWYFGNHAGIKFEDDGSITQLSDGRIDTIEGCSTISDCNGDLLFYTDGSIVWDRTHHVMPNGAGLLGGFTSAQSAVIVKKPNSNSIYFVFTVGNSGFLGLTYSIIDMNLNGGLGDVTSVKNVNLILNGTEAIGVVLNNDNNSFWIVGVDANMNAINAYALDSNGLNTTPVISPFYNQISEIGILRFSPDGNKLVYLDYKNYSVCFIGFDRSTGLLLNDYDIQILQNKEYPYGVEFSSSGNYLYITTSTLDTNKSHVYQYNMSSLPIVSSRTTIIELNFMLGALQRGNNGKIYVANMKYGLDVINYPNLPANACGYDQNVYSLNSKFGLPFFYQFNSFDIENQCLGYATDFKLNNTNNTNNTNVSNVVWDFGDGTTSTQINPSHIYANPGWYDVTVTGDVMGCLKKKIQIVQGPVINATPNQYICGNIGDAISLSPFDSLVLGTQSSTVFGVKYYDSLINCTNDVNSISTINFNQNNSTIYYKIYSISLPGCFINSQFDISFLNDPLFAINESYFICDNSSIQVSISNNFSSYHWSTGAIGSLVQITQAGNYSVTVDQVYPNKTCSTTKSFVVLNSNASTITNVMVNDLTAEANSVMIEVTGDGNYEYAIDGSNYQSSNVFEGLQPGSHTVYVMDTHNCGIVHQDFYIMEYPKFFTPNNDGNNDRWQIKYAHKQPDMMIVIYDRYGKIIDVFYGKDAGWNGTYNGNIMPSDDYWFVIKRKDKADVKGHFSLIRL